MSSIWEVIFISFTVDPSVLFESPTDQITGENIGNNATAYWAKVVEPCVITSTRWAVIFGNHGELKPVYQCVSAYF